MKLFGKVLKVIIDRKENDHYIGRSYKDSPEVDQEIYISNEGVIDHWTVL